jgi:hypothetical protein
MPVIGALPPDIEKRTQKIADKQGYEIQDPGTMFKNQDGTVWVFVVDKTTDMPLWLLVP